MRNVAGMPRPAPDPEEVRRPVELALSDRTGESDEILVRRSRRGRITSYNVCYTKLLRSYVRPRRLKNSFSFTSIFGKGVQISEMHFCPNRGRTPRNNFV